MAFEMRVEGMVPPTDSEDMDEVALTLLHSIGYISKGYDPKTPVESVKASVPFKLFMECFVLRPERDWRVEDLAIELGTSIPTVYRHLAKLRGFDLIEEEARDEGKSVHLKHYSLVGAWNVTEANIASAMKNYRTTVMTLQSMLEKEGSGRTVGQPADSHRTFAIRVKGAPPELDDGSSIDGHLSNFLNNIAYLTSREGSAEAADRIGFKLFKDCFLARPDRIWSADELRTKLRTTKPTVYRYVNRLDAMGLLDRVVVDETAPTKKGYRLRYGKLSRAWEFLEAYVKVALDGYRKTIEHLDKLAAPRKAELRAVPKKKNSPRRRMSGKKEKTSRSSRKKGGRKDAKGKKQRCSKTGR